MTADDVRRVARTYFIESNRTTGVFLPTGEVQRVKIPAAPDVADLLRDYEGGEAVSEGEALQPDPDFVEQRVQRETLDSGIQVVYLPIEMRGDLVRVSARLHFGSEKELKGKSAEISLMPMLMMRGTKEKSYQELQDAIDALQSRVTVGGFGRGGGAAEGTLPGSIQSDRQNYVAAIELLGEIMKTPAMDPKEFEIVREMICSFVEQGKSDPRALGMTEMQRKLNPFPKDSIHYVSTMEESLDELREATVEGIRELHEKYVGASHMEIGIMGDFDIEEARATIQRVFGDWKSPTEYERISTPFLAPSIEDLTINTPDKEMAIVGMATKVVMKDTDPDYPAMVLASYVLGESAKSRLMTRLRHKGGLSYGARASFRAGRMDEVANFSANAICAPQNAQKAIDAMRDEIQKWIAEGLSDDELEQAKKSYVLNFKGSMARETFVLSDLVRGLEDGRTMEFRKNLIEKIEALTADQIRGALQRTLGDAEMLEMMAGDFGRAASTSEEEVEDAKKAASAEAVPAGRG